MKNRDGTTIGSESIDLVKDIHWSVRVMEIAGGKQKRNTDGVFIVSVSLSKRKRQASARFIIVVIVIRRATRARVRRFINFINRRTISFALRMYFLCQRPYLPRHNSHVSVFSATSYPSINKQPNNNNNNSNNNNNNRNSHHW